MLGQSIIIPKGQGLGSEVTLDLLTLGLGLSGVALVAILVNPWLIRLPWLYALLVSFLAPGCALIVLGLAGKSRFWSLGQTYQEVYFWLGVVFMVVACLMGASLGVSVYKQTEKLRLRTPNP